LSREADVHVIELLLALTPIDGGAGGTGPADLALAQRRHQHKFQGPIDVRETTQSILQMDSRRWTQTENKKKFSIVFFLSLLNSFIN